MAEVNRWYDEKTGQYVVAASDYDAERERIADTMTDRNVTTEAGRLTAEEAAFTTAMRVVDVLVTEGLAGDIADYCREATIRQRLIGAAIKDEARSKGDEGLDSINDAAWVRMFAASRYPGVTDDWLDGEAGRHILDAEEPAALRFRDAIRAALGGGS